MKKGKNQLDDPMPDNELDDILDDDDALDEYDEDTLDDAFAEDEYSEDEYDEGEDEDIPDYTGFLTVYRGSISDVEVIRDMLAEADIEAYLHGDVMGGDSEVDEEPHTLGERVEVVVQEGDYEDALQYLDDHADEIEEREIEHYDAVEENYDFEPVDDTGMIADEI